MQLLIKNVKIKPSEMNIPYQDGYMAIITEENENLLYYKIIGYPKFSKIIRNGHDRIYQTVVNRKSKQPITSIVADLLNAKILLDDDIKFIGKVSYHRLAKAGVKNLAIILSGEIHVRINVDKTLEFMGPNIFENIGLFPTYGDARTWLYKLEN